MELRQVERQLDTHIEKMKDFMAGDGLRTIETRGLRISYSGPITYWRLKASPKTLKEEYPDLFEKRIGYETLRVAPTKYADIPIKTIATYEHPIDRAALLEQDDMEEEYDVRGIDTNDQEEWEEWDDG
ncbi:MAG: hypothetical protein ACFFFG_11965 [Candidatus Thorarchaeota archaeon]